MSNEDRPAGVNVGDHVEYFHSARRVQAQPNIIHARCAGIAQESGLYIVYSQETVSVMCLYTHAVEVLIGSSN